MTENIEGYLLSGGFAAATRATYRRILDDLTGYWPELGTISAAELLQWLESHTTWGGSMRRLALTVAQAYIRHAYGTSHPALALRVRHTPPPPGRTMTREQVNAVYAIFSPGTGSQREKKDTRDIALFTLLLDTGMRASEICSLQLQHIYLDDDYPNLKVLVKGGRWQWKVFTEMTAERVRTWMTLRAQIARPDVNTLFVGVGGLTPGGPMTSHGLRVVVRGWARRAGIDKLSPHDFRRTAATLAAEAGASDQVLMGQFGWRDPTMPRRYTQRLAIRRYLDYAPTQDLDK